MTKPNPPPVGDSLSILQFVITTPQNVLQVDNNGNLAVGVLVGSINTGQSTDQQVEIWRIMEADLVTGVNNIDVVFAGSINPGISAMSFSGVKQQAEEAEASSTVLTNGFISTPITTLTNGALIVSAVGNGDGAGSYNANGTGQVHRWQISPSSAHFAGTTEVNATAGTQLVSHTYTTAANRQAQYVAAFAPSTAAPPDAVNDLAATADSSSQITLTWSTPTLNGAVITNWRIERESPTGGGFGLVIDNHGGPSTTSFTDTLLTTGTDYNYKILSHSDQGDSGFSNEANAITDLILTETVAITDVLAIPTSFIQTLTETVAITDVLATPTSFIQALTETVTITDTVTTTALFVQTLT